MDVLTVLHDYSYDNRAMLEAASNCGCFYCCQIFAPSEIEKWAKRKGEETAICPHCGIDAVLPYGGKDYEIFTSLLNAMYERWFEQGTLL